MDPCLKGLFYKHFLGFKKCAYVGGCLSLCVPHVCWGPWKLKKTIGSPGTGASGLRVLYRTSKALAHQVSAQPSHSGFVLFLFLSLRKAFSLILTSSLV